MIKSNGNTKRKAGRPKKDSTTKRQKKEPSAKLLPLLKTTSFTYENGDDNKKSNNNIKSSLLILNRKKKHGSSQEKKPYVEQSRDWEQDEGFVYSRSQSQTKISTPEQQLQRTMDLLKNDNTTLELNDLKRPLNTTNLLHDLNISKRKSRKISHFQSSPDTTLPLNDEPRRSSVHGRRSSYHNRGRILEIEGYAGELHRDVPVQSYYKSLRGSPANQMRQLLIWCFKKQLSENFTNIKHDQDPAKSIAKVILDELIKSLQQKEISTNYHSIDQSQKMFTQIKKVPNPKNEINLQAIVKYKQILADLKSQKQQWLDAYAKLSNPVKSLPKLTELPSDPRHYTQTPQYQPIINNTDVTKMDQVLTSTQNTVDTEVPQLMDKFYYTSYKMSKMVELVEDIKTTKLDKSVSNRLTDYIIHDKKQPIPPHLNFFGWSNQNKYNTMDILRAIPKVEYPPEEGLSDK